MPDPPRPWYVEGFGPSYQELYAHRSDREATQALKLLDQAGASLEGTLLDLACGAGRHLEALGRRGVRALGLDLSPQLLRSARERGLRNLLRADMRRLPLADASLDGVLNMFTSFGYFESDAENFGVLEEIVRVLRPGGFLFFDYLNPERVRRDLRLESERRGERYRAEERRELRDGRVFKEMRVFENESGKELTRYRESVRLFAPEEIEAGAASRGLRLERFWGSYAGAEFEEGESPRWIAFFLREHP